ncbi:LPXTG cell wall anchor domain-containing protein [Alteribacillus sp. JSM 102045]|uniref:LPXTG cell wall anchor domain-containing protein n=1 Tax=Alteribacillus sp. JSM 102045 TaxID=1562101 RepID=UPI0035BF143B
MIVSTVYEFTGSYSTTFFVFVGFLIAALVLSILMKRNIAKIREGKGEQVEPELSPQ